ncbi:MAG TPA: hypothetical protein VFG20_17270, partial [Planctomycetaceae bacterium]|nr:hypothetical protein [Planctomycetaceae bacterium]
LAEQASMTEIAANQADKLIILNGKLAGEFLDLEMAESNLNGLITVEKKLAGQSQSVADAIQSLEVLTAFQDEFATQIQVLGEMRKSLIEIGLMEKSVAKAVRMLEPLLELGNVRRMSDTELRNAAKVILDNRTTRVSSNPVDGRPQGAERTDATLPDNGRTGEVPQPRD